ncbi:MAG: DUF4304 domain-containing protein [Fimbriimonadales bacterium]
MNRAERKLVERSLHDDFSRCLAPLRFLPSRWVWKRDRNHLHDLIELQRSSYGPEIFYINFAILVRALLPYSENFHLDWRFHLGDRVNFQLDLEQVGKADFDCILAKVVESAEKFFDAFPDCEAICRFVHTAEWGDIGVYRVLQEGCGYLERQVLPPDFPGLVTGSHLPS